MRQSRAAAVAAAKNMNDSSNNERQKSESFPLKNKKSRSILLCEQQQQQLFNKAGVYTQNRLPSNLTFAAPLLLALAPYNFILYILFLENE
jgi:hypothetical protein